MMVFLRGAGSRSAISLDNSSYTNVTRFLEPRMRGQLVMIGHMVIYRMEIHVETRTLIIIRVLI